MNPPMREMVIFDVLTIPFKVKIHGHSWQCSQPRLQPHRKVEPRSTDSYAAQFLHDAASVNEKRVRHNPFALLLTAPKLLQYDIFFY